MGRIVTGRAVAPIVTLTAAAIMAIGVPHEREARACSCYTPSSGPTLVSPERAVDAPLNAKVLIELPGRSWAPDTPVAVTLRPAGGGAVAIRTHLFKLGPFVTLAELTPKAPLSPETRYEVAFVNPTTYPTALVFGTFRTGAFVDKTAPRIEHMSSAAVVHWGSPLAGLGCGVRGPQVLVHVGAADPGRADARLSFGVWVGDASGRIDSSKPPTALLSLVSGSLYMGTIDACDPHDFPLPQAGPLWLGIAALDEAGNASAVRAVHVDLSRPGP